MDLQRHTFLTPRQAGIEIWGGWTPGIRKKTYRWLQEGLFDEIAERHGCPIVKEGNRYFVPMALIKAIRGDK
tara:strand:+ start:867 stop:1082 length:216 start_codon:yes stop_codon:yes gene_type:complete